MLIRLRFLGLAACAILAGLVLRLVPWGLPLTAHHVGGGLLWGAMLYGLVAAGRPPGWSRTAAVAVAIVVGCGIELLRLHRDPALDAFRATLAGQLLLGRLFSPWNMLTYAAGILAAAVATRRMTWTAHRGRRSVARQDG
ncbi:DUF2809 domain-containing protein [Methylobacterium sp. WL103]|uniref:ribosomal maturation YjgA family protein n=1 Tax=unclassified Methylobacterium TaxID=2615210 RepID=UPI0011CBEFDB|nr:MULTISPECIES: DUF2809 domain-containing protein [unclassified Methylobacterium]TXM75193.1 DUF2809 domain-containing protein [Methylobacterium sp. WL12]TXN02878.1 DUF2809 domain-containing protein [Methylobacterium sp. WL103]